MPARRGHTRRWMEWAAKLLLAAVLVVLLWNAVRSDEIAATLSRANPLFLAAAILLLPLNIFLQYHKWRLLVRSRFPLATAHDVGASLLLGFTFGVVTPARLGEFGGRAAGMRRRVTTEERRIPVTSRELRALFGEKLTVVTLTAVDKLSTMAITIIVGCIGLLSFCWLHPFMNPLLLTMLLLLAAGVGLHFLRAGWNSQESTNATVLRACSAMLPGKVRRRLREMRTAMRSLDAPRITRLLVFSALFYLTFLLQFYLLLSAFGRIDPLSALAGISTIMLVKTVIPPVTVGELGIREGASVYILGHAGMLAAAAFNASLLLFVINVLVPSVAGLAVLLRKPRAESLP
jgi:uncharacterized protein (TIRG00374 family)